MTSEDREAGPTEGEDLRPGQRDVDVIENEVLQAYVRARHARRDFVMIVDDVMRSPPVLAGLSVREGLCGGRAKTRTSDPPGGGDDLARSREPEIQDRRAAPGTPTPGSAG